MTFNEWAEEAEPTVEMEQEQWDREGNEKNAVSWKPGQGDIKIMGGPMSGERT